MENSVDIDQQRQASIRLYLIGYKIKAVNVNSKIDH